MKGDLISVQGVITSFGEAGLDPDRLLGANFVYQKIHTLDHRALHCETHLSMAAGSYAALYGADVEIAAGELGSEIGKLLSANSYPPGSSLVVLYIVPPSDGGTAPVRILSCEKQLLYRGYTLWHSLLKAVVVPYDCTFPLHRTAASLAAHNYALNYARSGGYDAAVARNSGGLLTGAGENPLFAASGTTVRTTPLECGVPDSVERRLGMDAVVKAGYRLEETPLNASDIGGFDELFTVTPQGIASFKQCGEALFTYSLARTVSKVMTATI